MTNYPILEYDYSIDAVLNPDHERLGVSLPLCAAFPIVGDCVDEYAVQHSLPTLAVYETVTKNYPVYKVSDQVCLCQAPMGGAVAVSFMDWLISYGVKTVISAGACGALIDLPENAFIVPRRALRDEGTSYHYMPPARWSYLDPAIQQCIMDVLSGNGIAYTEYDTWTTDAIFRETVDKVRRSRTEGCGVVDMECASMAACAEFRGVAFGQFMFTADTLADTDAFDARDWGKASLRPALELCLKVAEVCGEQRVGTGI